MPFLQSSISTKASSNTNIPIESNNDVADNVLSNVEVQKIETNIIDLSQSDVDDGNNTNRAPKGSKVLTAKLWLI